MNEILPEGLMDDVLDESILRELMEIDDESYAFIRKVSQTFFANADQLFESVELAFAEKNMQRIEKVAHQLKSSSLNVAATKLSALFQQLESESRQGHNEKARLLWPSIIREYELVGQAYQQLLNG